MPCRPVFRETCYCPTGLLFFLPSLEQPPCQKKKQKTERENMHTSLTLLYLNLIEWCLRFCSAFLLFLDANLTLAKTRCQECLEMFLMTCSQLHVPFIMCVIEWCLRFCFAFLVFLDANLTLVKKKCQECLKMLLMTCSQLHVPFMHVCVGQKQMSRMPSKIF